MSGENVIGFLRELGQRPALLDDLKVRSKSEVVAAAGAVGYPFAEPEFDSLIWSLEERLAAKRGEPFDITFPLWDVMWGKYYLEYLVLDLIPSFQETELID